MTSVYTKKSWLLLYVGKKFDKYAIHFLYTHILFEESDVQLLQRTITEFYRISVNFKIRKWFQTLNFKTAGRGVNLIPHPMVFQKMYLLKERVKLWFFVTFNIILKNIFPENFIEIPRVVQKLWRISLSMLAISIDFHQFYGFFDIFFWHWRYLMLVFFHFQHT